MVRIVAIASNSKAPQTIFSSQHCMFWPPIQKSVWITAGFHLFAVLCERRRFQPMIAQKQVGRFRFEVKS
jgi:hypothetical protein